MRKTLRLSEMPPFIIRQRGDRELADIPANELAACMASLLKHSPDLASEELKRAVLRLYGFKRLTGAAQVFLNRCLRLA